ncbi:DUF2790 domain-containing protein [Pseudomonas fluorescens]|uniref:DUF2790 domain-containing protein n=1 Tax=Pseudomonas fluorescens TaxID=294 RepID=A0A5E7FXR5_PSEFL|nr:DUF2790 domain-containing protein [Pseudomonas fluorescens]VVO41763.1 hypothetical protein PS691_05807 [Pseudomonas fluorescens]
MNLKTIYAAGLFAALNLCAISAQAQTTVNAQAYSYDTHLDIQKVLSMTQDAGPSCGVVNARLTYLDSQGLTQVLDYRKFADTCLEGG